MDPRRDLWDLPSSTKRFQMVLIINWDFRCGACSPEAMIDEARKRKVVIHRVIATVGGATYCDFGELKDLAKWHGMKKLKWS
jgi:hypothetical protein